MKMFLNKIKRTSLLIAVSFLWLACKTTKAPTSNSPTLTSVKKIEKFHEKEQVNFKTIKARLKGSYKTEKDEQSISISMRIKKGEGIWLSAKLAGVIPLAKIYITPNRVQAYEKINGTYWDSDFSFIQNYLNADLNYKNLESFLTGELIYPINKSFNLENNERYYALNKKEYQNLIFDILLDPTNFKVKQQRIAQPFNNRSLKIDYPSYSKVAGQWFPNRIEIQSKNKKENTNVSIDYRSVVFNEEVNFPYTVPKGYKKMIL